jgi:hypothetical protein
VKDKYSSDATIVRETLHHLSIQNQLLEIENLRLQEALNQQKKSNNRIFIAISDPTTRLQQPSPFAVRQAVCKSIGGTTLKDIPAASPINTGWAITPANRSVWDQLIT